MSGLGYRFRVSLPELDARGFTTAVQTACRRALLAAAKAFLAAAIPRIPVYTGFARGSLKNLEALTRTTAPITPRNGNRKLYYQRSVLRTPNNGRAYGTPAGEIFSQGRATIAEGQSAIFFKFHTNIDYYANLDVGSWGRNPGNWGSFKAGEQAFNAELRSQLDRLIPKIGDYIIRRRK